MILPALNTLQAIRLAFDRLNLQSDSNTGIAATAAAISSQLEILSERERAGNVFALSQLNRMAEILKSLLAYISEIPGVPASIYEAAESLMAKIQSIIQTQKDLRALESDLQGVRNTFQEIVSALTDQDHPNLSRFVRQHDTLVPLSHTIDITATDGKTWHITGNTAATCNWNIWPNALVHLSLTQWECNGQSGWGEDQEVQWHEFIRLNRK